MEDNKNNVEVFDDEKAILLDHDYDGIKELDHPLPMWWIAIFIATIVFAIPYWFYYHHLGGKSLLSSYSERLEKVQEKRDAFEKAKGGFDLTAFNAYVVTPESKKVGAKVFKRKCKACHGEEGQGGIGPNLSDNFWLHGQGSASDIYKTVNDGVMDKGMPNWGETLSKEQMMAVVDYVMKFKGTNPKDAKAPQGTEYP